MITPAAAQVRNVQLHTEASWTISIQMVREQKGNFASACTYLQHSSKTLSNYYKNV